MDRLWTPWRYDYISRIDHSDTSCVFCRILSEKDRDEANFVLARGKHLFLILNLFPYTVGHLLIVLNRHVRSLEEAGREELHSVMDTARMCEAALQQEYHPEGFNLGFNLGKVAGAGVEHHLHMHVLPRWTGDSSFVSIVSETRVLPEELPATYRRLRPRFRDLA